MIVVRLAKKDWGKAWRAMIGIAPVRLIRKDPIYEIMPSHLELLDSHGFAYEIVKEHRRGRAKRNDAASE